MMAEPNELPLPNATVSAFQAVGSRCQNIGLYFDRYLRFVVGSDWRIDTYDIPRPNRRPDQRSAKLWNLEQIIKVQTELNQRWQNSTIQRAITRWHKMVESQGAILFPMTPEWRFVVGLGDKTALEVGFTFHRIYGFPLIPGSALKGLARAVALSEIADMLGVPSLSLSQVKELGKNKTPLQKLDDWLLLSDADMAEQKQFELDKTKRELIHQFRRIFGTQHAAGEALFFEAVPAEAPKLEVDIMNVHYPDYYGDKGKPPADNQNPNPIPFLTIGQSPFWFAVGWRGKTADELLLKQAIAWLKTGLTDFGIGAKTAAGYGYFYSPEEMS